MSRIPGARSFGITSGCGLLAAGLLCVGLTGISTANAASGSAPVLTIDADYLGSFTDSFNPFVTHSGPAEAGATSLIYEPLLQFNTAKPLSAPYKWLARGYAWGASGKSINFTIRSGVK